MFVRKLEKTSKMPQNQFSSGLELANLLMASDPVHQAWSAIEKQKDQVNPNAESSLYTITKQSDDDSNPTIIAFGTPLGSLQGQEGLVSSSTLLKYKKMTQFQFLCSKTNQSFSINEAATNLFDRHHNELLSLKTKLVEKSKSDPTSLVIITGQSLGGSVAALFTISLLRDLDLMKTKRPLCITFGSPLVGDEHLQKCVLRFSAWKSCFLHVASNKDPTPKRFLTSGAYKPFGTFLLCSASGCACSEDPDFILEQLKTANSQSVRNPDLCFGLHYGQLLEDLKPNALCNSYFKSMEQEKDPLRASILTQLLAVGVLTEQDDTRISSLIGMVKKHETELLIQKKKLSNSDKKLNTMKTCLALMEWYKKEANLLNTGYYDMYKKQWNPSDVNVIEYKKRLWNFWHDSVKEVENKPQMEGAHFGVRWLWAGTNYRRMMEPLHIAEFYNKTGAKNYKNGGERLEHFVLLEKWLNQHLEKRPRKPREAPASSNEDSCFWAHVEDAIISSKVLKSARLITDAEKEVHDGIVKEFVMYLWGSIKNYQVSPEIFLEKSSLMKWWNECKEIVGTYSTDLADFMNSSPHHRYV